MISVEELTKQYGPVRAVDNATFRVERGETVGFLGPNGAGKTTTMRIMTGLFPPTAGDITVDGYSILTHPLEVKRRIGYLPEHTPVYLDMPVEAYLRFVAEVKRVPRAERTKQIEGVIESCALGEVRSRIARKLSKGFRQRLGLAQALIGDPPVIILDEPTAGLDPTQTVEFRRLIQRLRGERTIILSTHILPEVSMICDRVVIIAGGRIVAQDTPENLAHALRHTVEFSVCVDAGRDAEMETSRGEAVLAVLQSLPEVAEVTELRRPPSGGVLYRVRSAANVDARDAVVAQITGRRWRLLELVLATAGLEDVFMSLVTEEPTA